MEWMNTFRVSADKSLTKVSMKVNLKMITSMDMDDTFGMMESIIKDNLKTIRNPDMGNLPSRTEL